MSVLGYIRSTNEFVKTYGCRLRSYYHANFTFLSNFFILYSSISRFTKLFGFKLSIVLSISRIVLFDKQIQIINSKFLIHL